MSKLRDHPKLDPYLKWGLDSEFRGFKAPYRCVNGDWKLPVSMEMTFPLAAQLLKKTSFYPGGWLPGSRFINGEICQNRLSAILDSPFVKRFKLGLPSTPTGPPLIRLGTLGYQPGDPPVVAFIDHGVAFLNRCFNDSAGYPRIFSLWDQEDYGVKQIQPLSPWVASNFEYGRELDSGRLANWLADKAPGRTEDELYAMLDYQPCRKRIAHGTHVMDLAAGVTDPLGLMGQHDIASTAPIIAVQLPYKPFKDTSSSSLCVHVLDGLRFILSKVSGKRPIVVNISDGAYAGSHDGNSLLESAIDEFLLKQTHVTLVISAGNGFQQRLHAKSTAAHPASTLRWRVLPDTATDNFMEVWCPPIAGIAVEVTSPDGVEHRASLGDNKVLIASDGRTQIGGIYSSVDPDLNGSERGMFLLALAPTHPQLVANPAAPHGVWTISVTGTQKFDAYIQRNNPALGDRGPRRQSSFVDERSRTYVTGKSTLNNISTGEHPIIVGGYYMRGSLFDRYSGQRHRVADYSSAGPGRKACIPGVNVHAPSEDSPVLHGLLAAGVRSGTRVRLGGTSVATPVVSRFAVNHIGNLANPTPSGHLLDPSADDRPG